MAAALLLVELQHDKKRISRESLLNRSLIWFTVVIGRLYFTKNFDVMVSLPVTLGTLVRYGNHPSYQNLILLVSSINALITLVQKGNEPFLSKFSVFHFFHRLNTPL